MVEPKEKCFMAFKERMEATRTDSFEAGTVAGVWEPEEY